MIFISYRRDDTAPVARAIGEALRHRFGADKVFLDEDSLHGGEIWTDRLEKAVQGANVILALIGDRWLKAADAYGRRRLDIANDWVRNELVLAYEKGIDVIPLLIGDGVKVPDEEGLPDALKWLRSVQKMNIRNDAWRAGLNALVSTLKEQYGYTEVIKKAIYPEPGARKKDEPALSNDELQHALASLPDWEPVQSEYPPRRELRRSYHFGSFRDAVEFMAKAVVSIEKRPVHHPRWENQYRTVTVHFSTWDAGSKITRYDIDAAADLDTVYNDFMKEAMRIGAVR